VLVRFALARLMSSLPNCEVVAQADDAAHAFQALKTDSTIQLIVLEIALSGMNGVEFLRELQRRKIGAKSLIVSHVDSADMITQALLAGAQGYVLKSSSVEDLTSALETVRTSSKRYLPSSIAHLAEVTDNSYELSQQKPNDPLSPL